MTDEEEYEYGIHFTYKESAGDVEKGEADIAYVTEQIARDSLQMVRMYKNLYDEVRKAHLIKRPVGPWIAVEE
jgi:hypothetical protein